MAHRPPEADALETSRRSVAAEAPIGELTRLRQTPGRRALTIGLTAAVALLAGTTLAGFLAEQWWVFELASNLRLHLALALLAGAAALVGIRRVPVAIAALGAAALNLAVIAAAFTGPQPAAAASLGAGAPSLEVTFFNTKIVHADMDATIELLGSRGDDVVVLAGGFTGWVDAIEAADLDLHLLAGPHTHDGLELIALARDADAEVEVHWLGAERRDVFVEVRTEVDGLPVRVLGTHVVSPRTSPRATRRNAMLEWIPGWVSGGSSPAVVIGDLNATPWSPVLRRVTGEAGLVDSQLGHGFQPSYPASLRWFGLPIDHVLHTRDLTTVERHLGPSLGSDHRMVHAELTLAVPDDLEEHGG